LIDSNTGALVSLLARNTYISAGSAPSSIAPCTTAGFTKSGGFAFVADQGSNNILAYPIDPNTGHLTQQLGSYTWSGLSGPTSITLVGSENGFNDGVDDYACATYPVSLYVTNSLSNTVSIASSDDTGRVTFVGNTATGAGPTSGLYYDYAPIGANVPVLYVVSGTQNWSLSAYSINAGGSLSPATGNPYGIYEGSLIPIGPSSVAATQLSNETATGTTQTLEAYVTNPNTGTIQQYAVTAYNPLALSATTPDLEATGGTNVAPALSSMAIDDDTDFGTYLYAAAAGGVYGFSVNAANGDLSPLSGKPAPAGNGPLSIVILSGNDNFSEPTDFLYVTNFLDGTVSAYTINVATGALTVVPGSPFPCGSAPTSIAVTNRPSIFANDED
jgi:6-phosphogluconolactonase (cycloisomerase 2 family)